MTVLSPAIVLYSSNMQKVVKFYNRLGLTFVKEKHGDSIEHYACAFEGIALEIYPRAGRIAEGDRFRAMDYRIVLPVENLELALRSVRRLGKTLVSPKETSIGKSALISDPDGRHLLLIEKQG